MRCLPPLPKFARLRLRLRSVALERRWLGFQAFSLKGKNTKASCFRATFTPRSSSNGLRSDRIINQIGRSL